MKYRETGGSIVKSLGINMSVANLQAFALSKGITKAYEKMTQAEQTTLRYNYLMQATADAQGDFARTSDGYANSLRLLETNMDSLKATLGEALLPVVNSVVAGLNDLFAATEPKTAPQDAIRDLRNDFDNTSASIRAQAFSARHLTSQLISMGDYSELTAEKQGVWKAVAEELCGVMPELTSLIDAQNGGFRAGTEEIYKHIDALEQEAKAQALNETRQKIMQKAVDANEAYYTKAGAHEVAYAKFLNAQKERKAKEEEMLASYSMDAATLETQWNNALMRPSLTVGHTSTEIESDIRQWRALKAAENEASASAVKLHDERESLATQAEETQVVANEELNALEIFADQFGIVTENTSAFTDSMGNAEDATTAMTDTLQGLLKEGQSVTELFDELEQYRLSNFTQIKGQVEGVYDTFDKADRVRKTSAKKMEQGLQSQIEQLRRWQEARAQLREMGAGDDLLSEFSFSPESIAQMEALVKKGPEGIESISDLLATLKGEQQETAQLISDSTLAVDTAYQNLQTTAAEAEQTLTEKMAAIVAQSAEMNASVSTDAATAGDGLEGVQTAGDALGLSTWAPVLDAEDNASGIVKRLEDALTALDGKTVTVYIQSETLGSLPNGSHKAGLDYVPFDNYLARLHEGEAVLTKAEAGLWRAGGLPAAAATSSPAPLAAGAQVHQINNFNVPVQTPDEFAQTMKLYATYGLEGVI